MRMPDGTPFAFWDDATEYQRTYHVACAHPGASDGNLGTAEAPFATINRAAAILQPGEKVVVHGGVYRECVCPARGGEGPDRMIAYEAAPGEEVWQVAVKVEPGTGRRPTAKQGIAESH
jgi:hypothetical protein